jgi:hypothetical protein
LIKTPEIKNILFGNFESHKIAFQNARKKTFASINDLKSKTQCFDQERIKKFPTAAGFETEAKEATPITEKCKSTITNFNGLQALFLAIRGSL